MKSRILIAGAAAGLLLNVLGWLGNQLVLGRLWRTTIATVVPLRERTWVNELLSLAPDFIYGLALAWLFSVLVRGGCTRTVAAWQAMLWVWAVGAMTTYLGVWNSGLVPGRLAVATTVLALVIFPAAAYLVSKLMPVQVAASSSAA